MRVGRRQFLFLNLFFYRLIEKEVFSFLMGFGFFEIFIELLVIGKRFLFERNLLNLGNRSYLNLPNNKI